MRGAMLPGSSTLEVSIGLGRYFMSTPPVVTARNAGGRITGSVADPRCPPRTTREVPELTILDLPPHVPASVKQPVRGSEATTFQNQVGTSDLSPRGVSRVVHREAGGPRGSSGSAAKRQSRSTNGSGTARLSSLKDWM